MTFKNSLRNRMIGLLPFVYDFTESAKLFSQSFSWRRKGFAYPLPSLLKRTLVLTESIRFQATAFVETGTHVGDTVWFMRNHFKEIHTIEVFPPLYEAAVKRFRRNPNIHLHLGDSAEVLKTLCPQLEGRVLFWLDGHYSGPGTGKGKEETPIEQELFQIIHECRAAWSILIDDARLFGTDPAYPTVQSLVANLESMESGLSVAVANDMIRIEKPLFLPSTSK